jgi:hypothetical protein
MPKTPWIGLLALAALFVLPFLPEWLFEGPRTIVHRPRRHVCGDCGAPWTRNHDCRLEPAEPEDPPLPLRGELRQAAPGKAVIEARRRAIRARERR